MAERRLQLRRKSYCRAPIAAPSRNGAAERSQDPASELGILQCCGLDVESNRQHAAANVATHSLWINQPRRCNHDADADVGRKMHVGHDGNLLDVWRASEAFDRLRYVLVHRCGLPR